MEASLIDKLPSIEAIESELGTILRRASVLSQLRKALLRQAKEESLIRQVKADRMASAKTAQPRVSA